MAGRILVPGNPALDANADPYSGAKLYTYAPGGTTNRTAYTTSALNIAHANPVVADSAGRFADVWVDLNTPYRIVVKNADASVTLYDSDTGIGPIYGQGQATNAAPLSKSSAYAITSDDLNKRIECTGTFTLTLPLGATLSSGWGVRLVNVSTGTITVATSGSDTCDIAALNRFDVYDLVWDGSTWQADYVGGGQGRQAVWFPAAAMIPRTTNGAALNAAETTTNKVMVKTLDFDASTQECAQFSWRLPKGWDEGAITFAPEWTHGATTVNFGVVWSLAGVALSNDDALDAAFGTVQTSTDTGGTTNDAYAGPESAAVTIAGTPAAEDLVIFQVSRVVGDAADTMAVDAKLLGVTLYLNTDAPNDA